jgi:hypothetical protein
MSEKLEIEIENIGPFRSIHKFAHKEGEWKTSNKNPKKSVRE